MPDIVQRAVRLFNAQINRSQLPEAERQKAIAWVSRLPALTSIVSEAEVAATLATLEKERARDYCGQATPLALKFYAVVCKIRQQIPEGEETSTGETVAGMIMSLNLESVLQYVLRLCIPRQPVDIGTFKLCRNGQIAAM